MLASDDLLLMSGVTEVPNKKYIESVLVAVNCELLTCSVTKHGVHIDGIIRSVLLAAICSLEPYGTQQALVNSGDYKRCYGNCLQ